MHTTELKPIKALGTMWWFTLRQKNVPKGLEASIQDCMQDFEEEFSRFKPESKLSQLNHDRRLLNPSPEMHHLLEIAQEYYLLTDGLFNPMLGEVLESRGYDAEYSFKALRPVNLVPDPLRQIKIEPEQILLTGQGKLDFGGFGKGYLIDKLADLIHDQFQVDEYMINGGGDIYAAGDHPWEVILENPFATGTELARLNLNNQALAASSTQKRRWVDKYSGRTYNHLLDPTRLSKELEIGSFVVAPTAVAADILATVVCLIHDNEAKIQALQDKIHFKYLLAEPVSDRDQTLVPRQNKSSDKISIKNRKFVKK